MKNKKIIIIAIISSILFFSIISIGIYTLFDMQYSLKTGVSSRINITIDKEQEKIKIGTLDGYDIFIEGLKVNDCYFTTIDAKTIDLTDAIKERKISLDDMTRKADWKEAKNNKSIYYYQNYKIEITDKEVLIKNK